MTFFPFSSLRIRLWPLVLLAVLPALYGFRRLNDVEPGACVIGGMSSKEAFAGADWAFARNRAGLGMVAALALGAAWLGRNPLFPRWLKALVNVAKRLDPGDLDARSGMPGGREDLGQLAQDCDKMAAAMQMR
ncbi:MAG: hypothetical protein HY278_07100 [candidate division NC10 bacterium]|nr:hypothetical protein [candidate division NC10 bacterium]